ncbi:nuclear receptor subfamily 2, group F, member 1 [Rattus norvegicus]|uniref:Nuclear receptor subfamily 2, group F, member 1 n=1 Tax=Rattus norvegicus TaxID=10116 RepID=A6I4H5_RAT|nr:nuclear receptor subfamily 2, group F, member 1 [Rattus norvegicus]
MPCQQELSHRPAPPQPVPILPPQEVPQSGHEAGSGSARKNASNPAQSRPVRTHKRGSPQWPLLPVRLHLPAAASRALPHVALWQPVHAAQQHHGHREHLRVGRPPPLQRRRVGPQHPVLPGSADHRPGVPATPHLERAVRAQRGPVLHAPARGAAAGSSRPTRLAHVRGPGRGLHGPHPHLSGTGGEAQGAARRLCRVQLPQSHRAVHVRCLWPVGCCTHRKPAGEIAVCTGGIREEPVPQPAQPLWQTAAAIALSSHSVLFCHRAALLRPFGR